LLRPESLKATFMRYATAATNADELRRAQDEAIGQVVARQEAHGLPVVTDGEYRRLNWQVSFSEVDGWDLWKISWEGFRRHPDNRAPGERPHQRGADAVVSFRVPAGNLPTEEEQWRKLDVMLETARRVWGSQ
jgi:5-methyltetrahydropteroyltriglutamate--homocysteine methyltransferase